MLVQMSVFEMKLLKTSGIESDELFNTLNLKSGTYFKI